MSSVNHKKINFKYLQRAIEIALQAEALGNLPIGALIILDEEIIAEAGSSILFPAYHPGRHAEREALQLVPIKLWRRSREMTCYTTLEPCTMCMGTLLLHGIGRVVFGARDTEGGAGGLLQHLPDYYAGGTGVPEWIGPVMPETCDALYQRVRARFDKLPCGKSSFL
ncbi:MAG TPA: nucleoside deaminase [Pyrinomonadaceae bacterium]|nr:nucleoside deaminase [Pyrinomonadaceae bacterium]